MISDDIIGVMSDLAADMGSAPPTSFSVDSNVGSAITNATVSSGLSGSLVTVQQMIVRSEDDIRKILQELYNSIQTGSRAQGRFSTA